MVSTRQMLAPRRSVRIATHQETVARRIATEAISSSKKKVVARRRSSKAKIKTNKTLSTAMKALTISNQKKAKKDSNLAAPPTSSKKYVLTREIVQGIMMRENEEERKGFLNQLCNITAGNVSQIQSVIDENIIPSLVQLMKNSNAEFDTRKLVAVAISNAAVNGSRKQIEYLVSKGCMDPLCEFLAVDDEHVVSVVLNGIESILKLGEMKLNEWRSGQEKVDIRECIYI